KFEQGIIDKIEVVSVNNATLNLMESLLENKPLVFLEKAVLSGNEIIKMTVRNKDFNSQETAAISIFDITGKLLLKKNFAINTIETPANNLGMGLKIITLKIGKILIVNKLIVY
ncbi:MAG: hypothetical protein COZ74_08275, partial [Flavobacteriaceae bacterium CG_4_8_14_3_um_filter_31_8]